MTTALPARAAHSTSLAKPLTISPEDRRALALEGRVGGHTRLVPARACQSVIDDVAANSALANDMQAAMLAADLVTCYPDLLAWSKDRERQRDFKAYSTKLIEAFKGYPHHVGKAVVRSDTGLPSRLKFHPKVADVAKALEAERDVMLRMLTNAQSHIAEGKRRMEARQESDAIERSKGDASQRAAFAERMRARLRSGGAREGF